MMNPAQTLGPWTIEEYGDDETPNLVIHKDRESRICFMATPGSHGDPAIIEANARLICAAPDLLNALRGLVARATAPATADEDWEVEIQIAVRAIAKATTM